jgi:DNA-binding MarR family transcriptional regulator
MAISSSTQRGDIRQWVAYRLSILAAQNTRCLQAMYGPRFGLSISSWRVLTIVSVYAPLPASAVCLHTSLEPDKVSRALNSLVRRGLVARKRQTRDKRYFMLSLTAKGKQVNAEISRVRNAIEADFLSSLSRREVDSLYAILDKLQVQANIIFTGKDAWRRIVSRGGADGARPTLDRIAWRNGARANSSP